MTVDRRTALSLLGSGIGLTALAGCSETADDSAENGAGDDTGSPDGPQETVSLDRTLPSYASLLPETEGTGYFYGAIDVETMASLLEDEDAEAGEEPTDPLLGNPIVVALYCAYAIELVGRSPSFEAFNSSSETADDDETTETFVFADGVYAFAGTYDVEGFTAAIEERDAYTAETSQSAYAVYVHDESGEVVGISDDVYALSHPNESDDTFDPASAVERTVATAAGDRAPKHETDDGFERLLRAGASDGITLGLATTEAEFAQDTLESSSNDADGLTFSFDAFEGANGVHQRLSVSGDDATARAIVTYANADRVDLDRLESALGTDADTVETATAHDGTAAVIDAEYTGDLVDE